MTSPRKKETMPSSSKPSTVAIQNNHDETPKLSTQPSSTPKESTAKETSPKTISPEIIVTQQAQGHALHTLGSHVAILGTHSILVTCPYCKTQVYTRVKVKSGLVAWLTCSVLCLLGCGIGLFLFPCCFLLAFSGPIPLCVAGMKDIVHYCPNCNKVVGRIS